MLSNDGSLILVWSEIIIVGQTVGIQYSVHNTETIRNPLISKLAYFIYLQENEIVKRDALSKTSKALHFALAS